MTTTLHSQAQPAKQKSLARLLIQPKLTINEPRDFYELEADAMANQVMRSQTVARAKTGLIGKSLQRKCASCEEEGSINKMVMRKTEVGGEESVASPNLISLLSTKNGGGSPLPRETRRFMENAFSTDFSKVRIHSDSISAEMSNDIRARAFTYGNDIYFNSGQYNPNSTEGKHLLSHELTHVLQQNASATGQIQREYAIDLPNPEAVFEGLNPEQLEAAIRYNTRLNIALTDIVIIKDVLGADNLNTEIDASFVDAVALFQAQNNIRPDGKIGSITASRLARELRAQGLYLGNLAGADLLSSSRHMARRSMTVNIGVDAHQINKKGSANYEVNFNIPDRQANGWIIQHVIFSGHAVNCNGVSVQSVHSSMPDNNYWEGWRVVNGNIQCGFGSICQNADDTFRTMSEPHNTRGTIIVRGRVTFIPDYQLNMPPWQVGGNHPAHDLPHRNTPPENWNDSDAQLHQLTVQFDNCSNPQPDLIINTIPRQRSYN